jgi:hypothetical protein
MSVLIPSRYRIGGNPESGKEEPRFFWIEEISVSSKPPHPGARFPGGVLENPERAETSVKAPSGFLAFGPRKTMVSVVRENRKRVRENQFGSQLVKHSLMV